VSVESHGGGDMMMMMMMMPLGENYWTRPRERSGSPTSSHLGASRRSERRSENVAYSVSEIPQEILNMQ
jgi:hypothetical protein